MYETFPYYTQDGVNKGIDYECARNEYGSLDYANKRFIIKTIPPADDTIVKKTLITFKGNLFGGFAKGDMFTGRSYVDNISVDGIVFKGTDKELDMYALELMSKGYNIKDFFDYEEDNA